MVSTLNHYNFSLNKFISIHYMAHTSLLGEASIERGPSDAVVSAGELATFSCTLNVTGNEILQFEVFDTILNDSLSGCSVNMSTNSQTLCSWSDDGINMTCDYSVPYQITCNLTLSELTTDDSTQVSCFSEPRENAPPIDTAGLAVSG